MRKYLLVSFFCALVCTEMMAQPPPRIEDHFWKRKVVNRIDLNEKINAPLIKRESAFYNDNSQFSEKEGLVMTLFHGLKEGRVVAYHPDSLENPLGWEDVLQLIQEFEGSLTGGSDFDDGFGADLDTGEDFDSFEGDGEDDWGGEDWGGDGGLEGEDFDDMSGDDPIADTGFGGGEFDPGPFENVIHFVEDRIFDKTRSDMVYDIQFVEIIWTDPGETLPEKRLCTFRYKEILPLLENAQWKNRFNDAEYKTLREVFELRLFNSFIINVSGEGISSLQEAEYRRQKLVEFEHHLWSY